MPCISSSSSPPNGQQLALVIRALALAQPGTVSPDSNAAQLPDEAQRKLINQVHGILSAALPAAALKELATTIANQEQLSESTHLATLVRSWDGAPRETNFVRRRGESGVPAELAITILGSKDRLSILRRPNPNGQASPTPREVNIDDLWSKHVVLPTMDQAGGGPVPESLRNYAADYLRAHPAEDPAGFFRPFRREQSKAIDPARLQALFSHGDCADLKRWLLQSIPPEHRVFMGPFGEGPIHHEGWKNVRRGYGRSPYHSATPYFWR